MLAFCGFWRDDGVEGWRRGQERIDDIIKIPFVLPLEKLWRGFEKLSQDI
jgi:hypothetical protein